MNAKVCSEALLRTVNHEARQASLVIDSVAKAVANWTVDRHIEVNPFLPVRYGETWRADWIGHTLSQIQMLGQAVALRSPALFAQSVRWTYESFKSRGVVENDLARNLTALRSVFEQELPPSVSQRTSEFIDAAISTLGAGASESECETTSNPNFRKRMLQYLEAILQGDRHHAEKLIMTARTEGASMADIYENILAPAQTRLGWMWHRGEITIADEHFGSATTQAVMALLRPHFTLAPPNNRTVVATSTPGDLHEIGLRMVADLFEIDGWNVIYLGPNTPIPDLVEWLERHRANLLALSVSTALMLRQAGDLIDAVRANKSLSTLKLLVGGSPFASVPGLWRELGADDCAHSATSAVTLGNRLVAG